MQIEFTVSGLKPRQRHRQKRSRGKHPIAPVVQTIVLAFQIEKAIQDGRARDYAHAAEQLGMTRARVSQIMRLLRLPPPVIETILLADPKACARLTERQLRPIVAATEPITQREAFERLFFQTPS